MAENSNELLIEEYKIEPYIVNAYCGVCYNKDLSRIKLVQEDILLPTYPPQYRYHCPKCGKEFISHTNYPYIKYRYAYGTQEDVEL